VAFNDSKAGLGAATVAVAVEKLDQTVDLHEQRLDKLEIASPANMNEGNGTVIPFNMVWDIEPKGKVRQNFHVFNPEADPKVLLYLNSADALDEVPPVDKIVTTDWASNSYAALTSSAKGTDNLKVADATAFKQGDSVLVYQIVTASDAPAGTWELAKVKSVADNTINLTGKLTKTFTHCGETCGLAQVVRIERFKNLVVEIGGTVRPSDDLATHETKGGIVAIVADTITVKSGGSIHANGQGFEPGDSYQQNTSGYSETGHSECNVQENRYEQAANCSGGGGAHYWNCCFARGGGGGGGNRTAGANGTGSSNWGYGGTTKGDAGLSTLQFGGGGGYAYESSGGAGGGIVLLAATKITVEAGGVIEAKGNPGASNITNERAGGGGGAGGTVALFTSSYVNAGTVQASGGTGGDGYSNWEGGAGGEGWVQTNPDVAKFSIKALPGLVHILLDGKDITSQIGDPNGQGDPSWQAEGAWGNGLDPWSTGELDLTTLGTWYLGRHTLELREDGGLGGTLEMALYLIYPFSASYAPSNDTCTQPDVLDLSDGSELVIGTTEDSMGRVKAIDDFTQAGCGGDGGADVAYQFELTDWRRLTVDVSSSFTPRVYIRKGDCGAGAMVLCGQQHTVSSDFKPDTYYLFVDGDGTEEKGNFTLSVKADPPAPAANDTCAGATQLTLDANGKAQVYGVSLFSNDDYNAGCGGVGAPDLVYKVDVGAGYETLKATVDTTDFSPVVYIGNANCGTWVTCSPNKTATLTWPTAGTFYIAVDGKNAAAKGEFTLTVEVFRPL
jgi:hypothetical protein